MNAIPALRSSVNDRNWHFLGGPAKALGSSENGVTFTVPRRSPDRGG